MVKDHRTAHETGNVSAVMDGEIDGFIEAYLKLKRAKGSDQLSAVSRPEDDV
jgi:peptide chain release factor 2